MKSIDEVGITFANVVVGRGMYNNVVNITLGAYQFSPPVEGDEVDPDLAITARLRLDRPCAEQLYEALGRLLAAIRKKEAANARAEAMKTNGIAHDDDSASETLN